MHNNIFLALLFVINQSLQDRFHPCVCSAAAEADGADGEPRPGPGVAAVSLAETGLLALPPDAGHLAARDVPVARHVLPPVVDAAAPRGYVLPVEHFGPLLAEHGHLVPHKRERAAVNLGITSQQGKVHQLQSVTCGNG